MGIFSSIRDTIFGRAKVRAGAQDAATPAAPVATKPMSQHKPAFPPEHSQLGVDVEAVLDAMPNADELNWRTSIVDLMKLVGMDASYAERKELASEMGNATYSGTAEDNIRLHKQLMKELAANGGRVPAKLLA